MSYKRTLAVGFVGLLAAAACGSDDEGGGGTGGAGGSTGGTGGSVGGTGGAGATAGSGGTGATGGSPGGSGGTGGGSGGGAGTATSDGGGPISLTYKVVEVGAGVGLEPGLAGVEVCVVDENLDEVDATNLCVTTDAQGMFTLEGLTPGEQIILRYVVDGYVGGLSAVQLGDQDMAPAASFRVAANPADGGTYRPPGWDPAVTVEATKGSFNAVAVQATASDSGGGDTGGGFDWVSGVSFSITPAGGDGPFYVDASEAFVSGATATTDGWGAWFVNLDPGTYTLSASHATLDCVPAGAVFGWTNTDGTVSVPVFAGLNTQSLVFFCAPPPP